MVQRHVYLKFSDEFSSPPAIDEVVERTPSMLAGVPLVKRVRIGRPADPKSAVAWDLVLLVDFDAPEDVQPYLEHPDHVAYYRDFLKPRLEVIKAWNFSF